jgi:hypothetical protein
VVKKFKSAGVHKTRNASVDVEMAYRRVRVTLAYTNYKDILFENKTIGMRVKWPSFQALVLSNGLYGFSTWNCTAAELTKTDFASWATEKGIQYIRLAMAKWEESVSLR